MPVDRRHDSARGDYLPREFLFQPGFIAAVVTLRSPGDQTVRPRYLTRGALTFRRGSIFRTVRRNLWRPLHRNALILLFPFPIAINTDRSPLEIERCQLTTLHTRFDAIHDTANSAFVVLAVLLGCGSGHWITPRCPVPAEARPHRTRRARENTPTQLGAAAS